MFTRESLETGGEAVNTKRERCCRECFPFFSPPAFFPLSFPPRLLFLRSPAEFNSLVQDKRKKIITRLFFPAFRKIYVPPPRSSCSRVPNFANSERARVGNGLELFRDLFGYETLPRIIFSFPFVNSPRTTIHRSGISRYIVLARRGAVLRRIRKNKWNLSIQFVFNFRSNLSNGSGQIFNLKIPTEIR